MKALSVLFVALALTSGAVRADEFEGAYLDAPYKDLVHPRPLRPGQKAANKRNDVDQLITKQSPVKSQASRGTCSIFSAAALMESMLYIENRTNFLADLSEEYLEYVVMQNRTTEGSGSYTNIQKMYQHGIVDEQTWPYVGETWKDATTGLAKTRCGHLNGDVLASCLLGHRDTRLIAKTDAELASLDPELLQIRRSAYDNRDRYLAPWMSTASSYMTSIPTIKGTLDRGLPVLFDATFFYGAWNHSKAASLNIGRNMDHWAKGIIGYPEKESMDYKISKIPENAAGHSVLLVGYDDDIEVETKVLMQDGSYKTFKYKGVYFFKNSWGNNNFGLQTTINGKVYPGYGMITQKYAHEYGGFYRLPLRQ